MLFAAQPQHHKPQCHDRCSRPLCNYHNNTPPTPITTNTMTTRADRPPGNNYPITQQCTKHTRTPPATTTLHEPHHTQHATRNSTNSSNQPCPQHDPHTTRDSLMIHPNSTPAPTPQQHQSPHQGTNKNTEKKTFSLERR